MAYIHLTSLSKDGGNIPWRAGSLREYVEDSLGIAIDRDDILSVRTAVKEKVYLTTVYPDNYGRQRITRQQKTLLELISSQVKRDLEEVTAGLELHQKLPSIPDYSDPKVAENLKSVVFRCINSVDDSMLENDGTQSKEDDINKKYVAAVHRALDEASIDHGIVGLMEGYPTRLRVNAKQLEALKSSLNTKASIRAFYDFCTDTEWSKSIEGLSEEKKVLESLVGPDSDAILRTIDEKIGRAHV